MATIQDIKGIMRLYLSIHRGNSSANHPTQAVVCFDSSRHTGRHLSRVAAQENEILKFGNDMKVLVDHVCKVGLYNFRAIENYNVHILLFSCFYLSKYPEDLQFSTGGSPVK